MPTDSDLNSAIAGAQQLLGSYSAFANATEDKAAQSMFTAMAHDMEEHLRQLNDRLSYIKRGS